MQCPTKILNKLIYTAKEQVLIYTKVHVYYSLESAIVTKDVLLRSVFPFTLTLTQMADENESLNNTDQSGMLAKLAQQFKNSLSTLSGTPTADKVFKFWSTQPVPKIDEEIDAEGPIEEAVSVDQVRQQPYALPNGYEWCELDLESDQDVSAYVTVILI